MHVIILICVMFYSALGREDTPETVVITPKSMTKFLRISHKCESETKPPADSFKNLLKGVYENEAGLNFMICYLTEAGYVTEDGHFRTANLVGLVNEDYPKRGELEKMANECNKLVGKDHIDTLRQLFDCFRENTPVVFALKK